MIDVPNYLFGADMLVLCMVPQEAGSSRVLLKAYGYARTGKPILYLGPRNATYDYLVSRTFVQQFELSEIDLAAQWIEGNLADVQRNTVPSQDVGQDSFETRAIQLSKVLDELVC